jgi:hypothetical protein
MHQVTTDDPTFNALSRAGEDILVDKTTRRRFSSASSGSLLLTSAPFGWSGIVVEQHRPGGAFMDFFRLKDGKIVEHWDVIQQIPEKSANNNSMF